MLYTKTQYYFVNKTCGYPVLLTYAEDGNEDQVDYQLPQGGLHMSFRIWVSILCLSCSPKPYQSITKQIFSDWLIMAQAKH